MGKTLYTLLFGCVILIASSSLSCVKPPQRNPYTINDDMEELKWAEQFKAIDTADGVAKFFPTELLITRKFSSAGVIEYYRKVKPGTILHIDLYSALQPFGTSDENGVPATFGVSATMPIHYTFDIPVRQVNTKYGKLKSYEKDFLLTYLATNLRAPFTSIPSGASLVHLWNFVMNNLWLVKDATANTIMKARVDYRTLTTELLSVDPCFAGQLGPLTGTFQELILPRTNVQAISGYFDNSLPGHVVTPIFYDPNLADRTFSFASFTAIVDGAYYNRNLSTRELSTWSLYDWLYSGVPLYESNRRQKELKFIVFKKYSGRYRILYNTSPAGRSVYYNSGSFALRGMGDKKSIKEEDLVNIFPSAIQRLIFK